MLVSHLNSILRAEAIGGVAAGLAAGPLYGAGASWLKKLLPWVKTTEHPTGDNQQLQDHGRSTGDLELQAPLYEAKPSTKSKQAQPFVLDEGHTVV